MTHWGTVRTGANVGAKASSEPVKIPALPSVTTGKGSTRALRVQSTQLIPFSSSKQSNKSCVVKYYIIDK